MFLLDPADPTAPVAYSPTDIGKAGCPYLLLRTLDAKLGRAPEIEEPDEPLRRRAARLGEAHEERVLAAYIAEFGLHTPGSPGGVAVIGTGGPSSVVVGDETNDDDDARRQRYRDQLVPDRDETIAALRDGADVVFQATFFDGRLTGRADFLVRESGAEGGERWQVVDTKLTEKSRASALLQLAAYAEQLAQLGFEVAPEVVIHHGSGTKTGHRLADLIEVYRGERALVEGLLDAHQQLPGVTDWDAWSDPLGEPAEIALLPPGVDVLRGACLRCEACLPEVARTRDVSLVHGVRPVTRSRLWAAGIRTIDDLADLDDPARTLPAVTGVKPPVLQRLARQARLQCDQLAREVHLREVLPAPREVLNAAPEPLVSYEVIDPHLLALLPAPNPGDLFFDFEGDPLWTETGAVEGGLEYLFGFVDAHEAYHAYWAHDRATEKEALQAFLADLRERRQANPGLHVYHFAAYEPNQLTQLAERHGVGRGEVAALLREGVFVDLYPVVRHTVAISQPSYGLKSLEPLYLPPDARAGELTDGAASTEVFAAATAARAAGDSSREQELLAEIAEYNRVDCVSTKRLLEWLRSLAPQAPSSSVALSRLIDDDDDAPGPRTFPFPLRRSTRHLAWQLATAAGPAPRDADHQALALLGAALEYHQREELPYWRAHGERLAFPADYWADQRDVLALDRGVRTEAWSAQRTRFARRLRASGTVSGGATPESWGDVVLLYRAADVPGIAPEAGALHVTTTARVLEGGADGESATLLLEESVPGAFVARAGDAVPVAVVPGAPIPTPNIHRAIVGLAERVAAARGVLEPDPGLDLLRRARPRLTPPGEGGLPPADPSNPVPAIAAATAALDRSVLAVQGPPGTGKTYVGARVIAQLVRELGWRVGVVAQSHAVIENLLDEIVTGAGLDPALVGKVAKGDGPRRWTALDAGDQGKFLAEHAEGGGVLGGTLWDFTNRRRVRERELDLLVVDEAGQFSVANAVAVSTAAQRMLLLGDPQQLPQVTQGQHPEPVDVSALAWLTGGERTIPADRGYFLERTWRMHSALTRAVSELSYDGRLHAATQQTDARLLEGVQPGVHGVVVDHHGNTTASREEAREVVALVRESVGRQWSDAGVARPLGQRDVLVVAPYNAQVAAVRESLDDAGYPDVRVGTVDKFQGQEAVIAIVTLAASSGAEVSRGLGFLLHRNRLNVALSRAQWAAYVIRSRSLFDALPYDGEALADLGAFQRVVPEPGAAA